MTNLPGTTSAPFFPGFRPLEVMAGGVQFAGAIGGEGLPVLLLHGYPQTHIAWRRIAPELAKNHTVIIPDLPGYGSSQPLETTPRWTKRRVGDALVALMDALGYRRFTVVGHDRGARAGYRLVLDHPDSVTAFASLTVVPTLDAMASMDFRAATKAFHWFLFAQKADLPERLLAADPDAFINAALAQMTEGRGFIEATAMEAYRAAFRNPSVRHAILEDYRAAMDEDLAQDAADFAAGRKIHCPVLVLWPDAEHTKGRPTPADIWRRWATDVSGTSTGGGHLQPEDTPAQVLAALKPFLARSEV
ncbi:MULTISPECIES: alpha/beta fold hydrolase [unclassified Pseudomonas]|uniref:alpha/beta fold hydrolase n=1 Tax=unclassified Pseudomonas TaxID=196821 RepID=UPI0008712237|nr:MULTISPECIES: alpha/beta hydrolase [unclassified Pseudomonas]SCW78111.1 haloacetate dehalogenase [Pseudomonas sp. NFACC56-3]SFK39602.1 haloacetate dehalogenase [Pseudomonas sp. NFACC52]